MEKETAESIDEEFLKELPPMIFNGEDIPENQNPPGAVTKLEDLKSA